MRLFKGRYIIALYDKDDEFIDVFDNAHEFAEYLGRDPEMVWPILRMIELGERNGVCVDGRYINVFLIDATEEGS